MSKKMIYCPLIKSSIYRNDCDPCEMCEDDQTHTKENVKKAIEKYGDKIAKETNAAGIYLNGKLIHLNKNSCKKKTSKQ